MLSAVYSEIRSFHLSLKHLSRHNEIPRFQLRLQFHLVECKAKDISVSEEYRLGEFGNGLSEGIGTIPVNTKNFSYKTRFVLWKLIGISMSTCNV